MIIDIIIGVLFIGGFIHIAIAMLNKKVRSPLGSSRKSNLIYGIFLLSLSGILYLYMNGLNGLLQ